MTNGKVTARQKILSAAGEVTRDVGPAHLSLDAVAHRAGVSKGGLLYHFPSKAKLLEALVEQHLCEFDIALSEKDRDLQGAPNSLLAAYLEIFMTDLQQCEPPPSGILAAMAENPGFLAPVRRYNRILLDRMKASSQCESAALIVYLALEGMRSLRLFDIDILTPEEQQLALASLGEIATAKS